MLRSAKWILEQSAWICEICCVVANVPRDICVTGRKTNRILRNEPPNVSVVPSCSIVVEFGIAIPFSGRECVAGFVGGTGLSDDVAKGSVLDVVGDRCRIGARIVFGDVLDRAEVIGQQTTSSSASSIASGRSTLCPCRMRSVKVPLSSKTRMMLSTHPKPRISLKRCCTKDQRIDGQDSDGIRLLEEVIRKGNE